MHSANELELAVKARDSRPIHTSPLMAAAAGVAACSGGDDADDGAGPLLPEPVPFTTTDASRLMAQGSFGATREEIDRVQALGVQGWMEEQFAAPRTEGHVDWLRAQGYVREDNMFARSSLDYTVWRKFLSSPDQLRQRMVYALSQIIVISVEGLNGHYAAARAAHYLDILETHAFGNYRDLLEAVTLSAPMGYYLSMRGSRKADASGRRPDENYAREIMQLFSIGLVLLNQDGTPRAVANGDTYTEADVAGLARVFTGWDYAPETADPIGRYVVPMVNFASRHETMEKTFLGVTIPPNTSAEDSLRIALDTLFNHPNVGPFIGRQLIQRFVTSNPSPAYVARVAAAFADNGSGVRGDLRAVLRAVLEDFEARDPSTARSNPTFGKLREPVLRFAQWARASRASSPSGAWRIPDLSSTGTRLGQSPLHSPSVFNFYRPGYVPPGTGIAAAGKSAPEFQITTETSVAAYVNFMVGTVASGNGIVGSDVVPDYGAWLAMASDAQALASEANLVLAAGQLSDARVGLIRDAVATFSGADAVGLLRRVQTTLVLTLAAPEYLAMK
jgi:uncharacterized protein (DUF1800 family)